jgi:hypothetical protein
MHPQPNNHATIHHTRRVRALPSIQLEDVAKRPAPCIRCGALTCHCAATHHNAMYGGTYPARRAAALHLQPCAYCPAPATDADHDEPGNPNSALTPSCAPCNRSRRNQPDTPTRPTTRGTSKLEAPTNSS